MKWILAALVVVCAVSLSSAEVRYQYPSRQGRKFDPNEIISDRKKVLNALKCIRGDGCHFPRKYSNFLQEAGPTLLVYGRCPYGKCSLDEEEKAKDLLLKISNTYRPAFMYTYNVVRSRFPH